MFSKRRFLKVFLISTLAVTLFFTGVVFSSSVNQEIRAILNKGLSFQLDGQPMVLTDSSGNKIYPITYEGTTYVPLRVISNIFKTPIDYDKNSNKVILGSNNIEKSLLDFDIKRGNSSFSDFQKTVDPNQLTFTGINGTITYKKGLIYTIENYVSSRDLTINIDGKYQKLTFAVNCSKDITLAVVNGDSNIELQNKNVGKDFVYYDVDVSGVKQLILRPNDDNMKLIIADPILK